MSHDYLVFVGWFIRSVCLSDELQGYYANLTTLIEQSYLINKKPAIVVAHSLGNMVSPITTQSLRDYPITASLPNHYETTQSL